MKLEFIPRACPLCGGDDFHVLAEATIVEGRLTDSAFASRKLPEYMHSRMVECRLCGMLYANPVLRPETLADAYKEASFDSGAESRLAATTYRALLDPHLTALPSRRSALDIGAGDGAFVEELLGLGFDDVIGVEPNEVPDLHVRHALFGDETTDVAVGGPEPGHHRLCGVVDGLAAERVR